MIASRAMRIFETYPPSMILLALVVGAGMVVGGLQSGFLLLAGALVMAIGNYLDFYGVREAPRQAVKQRRRED